MAIRWPHVEKHTPGQLSLCSSGSKHANYRPHHLAMKKVLQEWKNSPACGFLFKSMCDLHLRRLQHWLISSFTMKRCPTSRSIDHLPAFVHMNITGRSVTDLTRASCWPFRCQTCTMFAFTPDPCALSVYGEPFSVEQPIRTTLDATWEPSRWKQGENIDCNKPGKWPLEYF